MSDNDYKNKRTTKLLENTDDITSVKRNRYRFEDEEPARLGLLKKIPRETEGDYRRRIETSRKRREL